MAALPIALRLPTEGGPDECAWSISEEDLRLLLDPVRAGEPEASPATGILTDSTFAVSDEELRDFVDVAHADSPETASANVPSAEFDLVEDELAVRNHAQKRSMIHVAEAYRYEHLGCDVTIIRKSAGNA